MSSISRADSKNYTLREKRPNKIILIEFYLESSMRDQSQNKHPDISVYTKWMTP